MNSEHIIKNPHLQTAYQTYILLCKEAKCNALTCRSKVAALQSSFLAAIWRAGRRTLPLVSFSKSTATTFSCSCCIATAKGVNPSWNRHHHHTTLGKYHLFYSMWINGTRYLNSKLLNCRCNEVSAHNDLLLQYKIPILEAVNFNNRQFHCPWCTKTPTKLPPSIHHCPQYTTTLPYTATNCGEQIMMLYLGISVCQYRV